MARKRKPQRYYSGPSLTDHLDIKAGDLVELTLGPLLDSGEAQAMLDGAPVMVAGGLPGEAVTAEVVKKFPERIAAKVVGVRSGSPDRVTPPCPYYLACSGCQLMHASYPRQLEIKRERVASEMAKHETLRGLDVSETMPSPQQFGYRNHARFTIRRGGELHGAVGYVNATTRQFLKIDRCLLMDEGINAALIAMQGRMQGMSQMSVRAGADHLMIQPVLPATGHGLASGQKHIEEEVLGRRFRIAGPSFFQVNTAQLANLIGLIKTGLALTGAEVVVDAYCGVGTFAILLASYARKVIGIEDSASAVADATHNALGLTNVEFTEGKAEVVMAEVQDKVDAVVLDPPRAGCHPGTIEAVCRLRPERVALVSCEPASLARDLVALLNGPFMLESVQPVDMFPQTRHVEAVAFLKLAR